jgi:hypothetical protein
MMEMKTGYKIILILTIIFGLIEVVLIAGIISQNQITPNDEFFVVDIGDSPIIDVDNWTLEVDGLVANELSLTYDNITSFPSVSEIVTLRCVDGPTGTADWKGVRLSAVLDMAGVLPNATELVFYAADGYSSSITLDYADNDDVILAYEMNGETLPVDHGRPLRLVAPGKFGYKWVKWITHIEVIGHDYRGFWESRGWNDDADILMDWGPHAIMLTLSAYIGSLALVSGFRFSKRVEFGYKLPSMFSKKFHLGTSVLYYATMLGTSIYWVNTAFQRKGSFPNVPHGYLALVVMALAILGIVSGLLMKKMKGDDVRLFHFTVNVLGYLLILGTILTGLVISGIIV